MVTRYWLGVACAEHVRKGRAGGFMQLNHGKPAPLRRLSPGDGVVYYSPSQRMGARDGYQSFTAIGFVGPRPPYSGENGMFRRDVEWLAAAEHPIRPLLDWLDFTQGENWGYQLRFGLLAIPEVDFDFLRHVMTQPALLSA